MAIVIFIVVLLLVCNFVKYQCNFVDILSGGVQRNGGWRNNNRQNNNRQKNDSAKAIKTLIRQAARWSVAANQDENPMIAVMHANYGAGYLWAANDIATSSEIERVAGIDYKKFKSLITAAQDSAMRKMAGVCPKYVPEGSYLMKIAGEA